MSQLPPDIAKHLAGRYQTAEGVPLAGVMEEDFRRVIRAHLLSTANLLHQLRNEPERFRGKSEWESAKGDAEARLRTECSAEDASTLVEQVSTMLKELPTNPRRTPYEYWVYAMHLQSVRMAARDRFGDIPLPWLETLGLGHVQGGVKKFDAHWLMLIRSGTKGFTNLASKALIGHLYEAEQYLKASPERSEDSDPLPLIRNLKSTAAFATVFRSYLFLGFPHAAEFVALDEDRWFLANRLEAAMDRFIVAHELAHIILDDAMPGQTDYDQEVEADRLAIVLLVESAMNRGSDGVFEMCGAHVIIILQQVVLMFLRKITGDATLGADYPPAPVRCCRLFGACENKGLLTPQMEQMTLAYWGILKGLGEAIEPQILHEAKTRKLAPLWRHA